MCPQSWTHPLMHPPTQTRYDKYWENDWITQHITYSIITVYHHPSFAKTVLCRLAPLFAPLVARHLKKKLTDNGRRVIHLRKSRPSLLFHRAQKWRGTVPESQLEYFNWELFNFHFDIWNGCRGNFASQSRNQVESGTEFYVIPDLQTPTRMWDESFDFGSGGNFVNYVW